MVTLKVKQLCLYCGEPTKRGRKGEHIVPEAIGGAVTLNDVPNRAVCLKCNSGVLSQLDKELCSRSYLSVIASREIGAHLWQAWDVDNESNNLLVEARPEWAADESLNALISYPQITFERSGPEVRGDAVEFRQFGQEEATKVLFQAVRHCFGRYRDGEKGALNFERVRSGVIHDGYRLAPRIFTPHPIDEVVSNIRKQSFVLRFGSEEDKHFALQSLPNLNDGSQLKKWTHKLGSHFPTICFFFDIADTMRALMKLGLNLIAAHCPNTPVNHESFARAIRVIRGEAGQIPPRVMMSNGFVHAEDVQAIKAEGNAHSFRLVHVDGKWHVFSSFFGGQVGSYVRVPGPSYEGWRCADIEAPLGSKDWTCRTSTILPYMKMRVVWNDGKVVTPSFKLQNTVSSVSVELVKKKSPRR
jgi:hypothetical protein